LLNALRALHSIRFSDGFGEETEEDELSGKSKIDRNSFLNFLHEDDDDDLDKLLK